MIIITFIFKFFYYIEINSILYIKLILNKYFQIIKYKSQVYIIINYKV